jgi:hypothetical protein
MRFRWNVISSSLGKGAVVRGGKILMGDETLRAGDEELLGWESPTYGERCPAISLLYRVRARLPVRIVTVILAGETLQLRQGGGDLLLSRGATQIYQVSLSPAHSEKARG